MLAILADDTQRSRIQIVRNDFFGDDSYTTIVVAARTQQRTTADAHRTLSKAVMVEADPLVH